MAKPKRTAPKPASKGDEGFTTSMLVRMPPELLKRIDARVAELQAERPGMSRSDFVREAILAKLRER